ncbi:hypothetical protein [Dysgonomonas sp. ZJ279]|uniref:hypothetical protein n=1 Tax=Dysgonomonas sp. ZJ279 TaxID=2709796 RepID=UPI0013ECF5FE|nr:hypothetical protein [Dysgonomonas sp. ZJ279]
MAKSKTANDIKNEVIADIKTQAELDAKAKADAELKAQAELEAKAKADAELKAQAELDAKAKADAELKAQAELEPSKDDIARNRIADDVFAKFPTLSTVYFSADLVPFGTEADAERHAKGLDEQTIYTVTKPIE